MVDKNTTKVDITIKAKLDTTIKGKGHTASLDGAILGVVEGLEVEWVAWDCRWVDTWRPS